jgi:hypothetical protein
MHSIRALRQPLAVLGAILLTVLVVGPAMAHEQRDVHGFTVEVGLINEPVFVGDKSGLELIVHQGDAAVTGLEKTLKAEVIYGTSHRDLPLEAREGEDGTYQSQFIPTAAGKYTFHITGTLPDGSAVDESFTSSPTGFNEVEEQSSGQFPVQFPSQAELSSQARKGSDAAGQVTIALGLGGLGTLLGLAALGIAVAGRSRAR